MKEDIEIRGDSLFIEAVARKGGRRTAPLELWLDLPYVDLIVEQWKQTPTVGIYGKFDYAIVWPISEWDSWHLMKLIDQKKYPHFLRCMHACRYLAVQDQHGSFT